MYACVNVSSGAFVVWCDIIPVNSICAALSQSHLVHGKVWPQDPEQASGNSGLNTQGKNPQQNTDFKRRFDFQLNKGKTLSFPTHLRRSHNCQTAKWWASYSKRNLASDRWKQHMKALIFWMVINFRLILFWACCVQTCSVEEKACWAEKTSSSPSCA